MVGGADRMADLFLTNFRFTFAELIDTIGPTVRQTYQTVDRGS
jgi:hypothetical protein